VVGGQLQWRLRATGMHDKLQPPSHRQLPKLLLQDIRLWHIVAGVGLMGWEGCSNV
jgi:hypothetical protein